MKKILMILCAVFLIFGIASTSQANLIDNGDFEDGLNDWTTYGGVSVGTYGGSNHYAYLDTTYSVGTTGLYQYFYMTPDTATLDISFDYLFSEYDNAKHYTDIFDSSVSIFFAPSICWELEYLDFIVLETEDSRGIVHFDTSYTINGAFQDYDPNAVIQFNLTEARALFSDKTESWAGVDNVNITGIPAPVPEPATMLLLGSGLIGLAGISRRRKMKKN